MSFERLRRIPRTVGFRLALWSAAFFVLSTGVAFGLAYVLVSASLEQSDREEIRLELGELSTLYRTGGLSRLVDELALQEREGTNEPFLVRVLGAGGGAPFVMTPARWKGFDLTRLNPAPREWQILPHRRGKKTLEVTSLRMPDGAVLQVGQTTTDRDKVLARFRATVGRVVAPLMILSLAGGVVIALRALRPIRHIIETVRAIEAGAMDARVLMRHTGDELDELGRLFNGMLDRISTLIAGMRGALDAVAHDLRTPVTRMRVAAELSLRGDPDEATTRHILADCVEDCDQLLTFLNTLMDVSEAETGLLTLKLEELDVSALVEDAVDLYRYVAQEKQITITTAAPPSLWLRADRSRLRQVLANLLDNAIKYTAAGGWVEVEALEEPTGLLIRVRDSGIGLAPEEIPRIWDRLYRGDQSRSERGLGLGLSLVRAVARAHGGEVSVGSVLGAGSTFTIRFPLPALVRAPAANLSEM
ncbi:MAG TPA: HAMP domain-containing sensor histidine kinase [Methylomirabilota bacterium]|nr:HAMP domain-containing sensor histidine kinase [Methylomirabilota bacterium]